MHSSRAAGKPCYPQQSCGPAACPSVGEQPLSQPDEPDRGPTSSSCRRPNCTASSHLSAHHWASKQGLGRAHLDQLLGNGHSYPSVPMVSSLAADTWQAGSTCTGPSAKGLTWASCRATATAVSIMTGSTLRPLPPLPGVLVRTRLAGPSQGPAVSSSYLYDERVWPLASLHQRHAMLSNLQHVVRLLPHQHAPFDQSAAGHSTDTG